ncbi:MAG: nitroreductase family protein [Spirochaetia bacterium]
MNFLPVAKARKSIRSYSEKPVGRDLLHRCVEAASLAPSACNSQPWHFVIVDDPVLKDKVSKETFDPVVSFNKFTLEAPVMIAVLAKPSKLSAQVGDVLRKTRFNIIDVSMAAEHFCLQAASEGLGTCMLGWFNERRVKQILQIPKHLKVVMLISAGYPKKDGTGKKHKKTVFEIASINRYGNPFSAGKAEIHEKNSE